MSGTILVKELNRHIAAPEPPRYFSVPSKAAWRRGFMARCWRGPVINAATTPYRRRYMAQAWRLGWDVANVMIAQETA